MGAEGVKLQLTYWGSVPQVSETVSAKPLRLESVTEVVVWCWVWIVNCGFERAIVKSGGSCMVSSNGADVLPVCAASPG